MNVGSVVHAMHTPEITEQIRSITEHLLELSKQYDLARRVAASDVAARIAHEQMPEAINDLKFYQEELTRRTPRA